MSQPVYNFSAGPGVMPRAVLEQVREEMLDKDGSGVSVFEMSHRGKAYVKIAQQAEADARTLMKIPDDYAVLFLQGGASLQFTMWSKNLLAHHKADFIVTGAWGKKAVEAAKIEGDAHVAYDAKASNYNHAPDVDEVQLRDDANYLHITLNETIQGVDFLADPSSGKEVICDMSSCIASRPFDVSRYALIYAGAQKNLGPAGATLVIMRKDLLERVPAGLPPMLDYKVQAENEWMYNTPPTGAVYMCGLVFQHWLKFGGLEKVAEMNEAKAKLIYDAIDGSGGFYRGHAVEKNRSRMNIPFVLGSDELTDAFVKEATAHGMIELKGHRSVGGCRASVYNAMPMEGAKALADFMADFARRNG